MSSDQLHRIVFENSPDGILLVGPDGRVQDANPAALAMFGWTSDELLGERIEVLVPSDARDTHAGHRKRFVAEARVPRPMGIGLELRGLRKDGSEFPVEISLSPVGDGRSIATVRDTSLRKRLRDFGAGALRATEEVRAEIARELHDQTAQEIAALMIRLRLVERSIGEAPEVREKIDELRSGLEQTAEGVRRIARGLRPPELEDAGLDAALAAHARRIHEERGLHVELDVAPVDAVLRTDSRLIVYRIVQEALNNVARHAETDRASVRLWMDDAQVHAEVVDRGRGFSQHPATRDGGGLGLMGMYERAAMVGGRLDVHSVVGEGTRIHLVIPVEFVPELHRV